MGRGASSKRSLEECNGFPVTSSSNDASRPGVNVAGITIYLQCVKSIVSVCFESNAEGSECDI